MFRANTLCLLFLVTMGMAVGSEGPAITWEYRAPLGEVDSSPAVVDLDSDGRDDLVVTTTAGSTLAIDAEGHRMWMHGVQIPISISPTVADITGDTAPEVLVVNQSGRIFCLAGRTGLPLWHHDLPGGIEWGTATLVVADLDGDGTREIVTGDEAGHVVCLNGDGESIWQYDGDHGQTFCPAVGALGGEERLSILIAGSKRTLTCLDTQGAVRWQLAEGRGSAPIIADLDGDGANEIVAAINNRLVRVNADGTVAWGYDTPKDIDATITVADVDGNGVLEVYAIDLSGAVVCLTPEGQPRWTANVRERVRRMPAVADLDNDGALELYVAGYSGELHIFNAAGEQEEAIAMPGTTNASPTVADLSGTGVVSLVYAGSGGSLVCYTWPGEGSALGAPVAQYRYDAARTGVYQPAGAASKVRIARVDFGNLYGGSNTITASVENPAGAAMRIVLSAARASHDGRTREFETADAAVEVAMDYTVPLEAPSPWELSCRVYEGDTVVAERRRTAYIIPFRKELADLEGALDAVEDAARALPDGFDLIGRVAALRERVPGYQHQAELTGTLEDIVRLELRDALSRDITEVRGLARWAEAARDYHVNGDWPLRLDAANPWAPFGGFDELDEGRLSDAALGVEAFQGEIESAALNIFNYGAAPQQTRIEIAPLVLEGTETTVLPQDAVVLHEVVAVPTQTLDLSADALPRMNQGHTLMVPGRDARQCWLNIDTTALTPGTWTSTVRVRTLEVVSKTYEAPLTVTVWDVPQADTSVLRHCNWGYVARSFLKDNEDASLQDRVAHHNNVFVTSFVPRAQFDESGALVGDVDFGEHDAFVKRYSPHGLILFHNTGGISGPVGRESEIYKKAFVAWMRAWVAHMKELGIDYSQYAMYPVDEPGLREGLVDLYLYYAKLAREADPNILMYTDPVSRITEDELREMLPYVDIWCPNRNGFLLDSGAEKLAIIKSSGETLWNYECEGNAKHQSPLGYYRGQAWLAWHHGLTGIGFWSYCTSSADPWYFPEGTNDYLLVYPGDGPVSSKRWEAVRDGVEDYAMLVRLRDAVAEAKAAGRAPETVAEAELLLSERASAIGAFCGVDDDGTTPGKEGIPGVRRVADTRLAAITEARRDMARLLGMLDGKE